MHNVKITRHRYAYCSVLSAIASLLSFVNPLLSSVLVHKFTHHAPIEDLLPLALSMIVVTGVRLYLRFTISSMLIGSQRAPIFWLQRRIGLRLWWLERLVGSWGFVGMVVRRVSGKKGLAAQVASFISYSLTDAVTTVLSGFVYYVTKSYLLSLFSALILPTLVIVPWITQKTLRLERLRQLHYRVK